MSKATEKKDYYAKDADLLPVPRVYIYDPRSKKNSVDFPYSNYVGRDFKAWAAWMSSLRYIMGDVTSWTSYDFYTEPSNPGCPCGL